MYVLVSLKDTLRSAGRRVHYNYYRDSGSVIHNFEELNKVIKELSTNIAAMLPKQT